MKELISENLPVPSAHTQHPESAAQKGLGSPLQSSPAPPIPTTIKETGLNGQFLCDLVLKSLHLLGLETITDIADRLKLSPIVVERLLTSMKQLKLVEVPGSIGGTVPVLRYALTAEGKAQAIEASTHCEYLGPAPVTLAAYQRQVQEQTIQNENITVEDLSGALAHLVLPQSLIRRLGPAVNSSRGILIYGPPGNGKTAISEAVGGVFKQAVYVPYGIEVDGQIIRIFDPTVHARADCQQGPDGGPAESQSILKKKPDPRWVRCRRPVIIMGGELTLSMLDLRYDANSKFYEAPPQVKAVGGVFIIDDFGRQLVQPRDLLNRWIVPLEKRVDYLTIHTGKKFDIPFDELIIFSTNIPPNDLMDAALMRRVKYKLRVEAPTPRDYVVIFQRVCQQHGLKFESSLARYLLEEFYPQTGLECSAYHPRFIVEHALATCRYQRVAPQLTRELVDDALENLHITDSAPGGNTEPLRALDSALKNVGSEYAGSIPIA